MRGCWCCCSHSVQHATPLLPLLAYGMHHAHQDRPGVELLLREQPGGEARLGLHLQGGHRGTWQPLSTPPGAFEASEASDPGWMPSALTAEMTSCRNRNGGLLSSLSVSFGRSTSGSSGDCRISRVRCHTESSIIAAKCLVASLEQHQQLAARFRRVACGSASIERWEALARRESSEPSS